MSLPIERRRARVRSPSGARLMAWLSLAATGGVIGWFFLQAGAFNALQPRPPGTGETTVTATRDSEAVDATPAAAKGGAAEQASIWRSQFNGFDKQRQPFSVKAERAVQDRTDASKVHMQRVVAELTRNTGEEIAISSLKALYDADRKSIDLDGEVKLSSRDQFTATMAKAVVSIDDKKFSSTAPVIVTHRRGEIRANGMEITDDGRRIVFFNRVKATFWGNANKGSEQQ